MADDEAEAEAYARSLLAKVTGKAAPLPGQRGAAAFYGAAGSGSGNLGRRASLGPSEEDVRAKVGRALAWKLPGELLPKAGC